VDRQVKGSLNQSSYFPDHQDHPIHLHKLLSLLTLKLRQGLKHFWKLQESLV